MNAGPEVITYYRGASDQTVSDRDRGLNYGDGVFETCRLYGQRFPLWPWHLARLELGLSRLGLEFNPQRFIEEPRQIASACKKRGWASARVRLTVTREPGERGSYPTSSAVDTRWQAWEYRENPSATHQVANLRVASKPLEMPRNLAGLKHLNRLPYILAALNEPLDPGEELLFCDSEKRLVETMHHNIFFLSDRGIETPAFHRCGVEGVARAFIRDVLAPQMKLEFLERDIELEDLSAYRACWIANALVGVQSVGKLGHHSFETSDVVVQMQNAFESALRSAA